MLHYYKEVSLGRLEKRMMDIADAVRERHSVRRYTDQPIEPDLRAILREEIERCNAEGNLHMTLVCDEPEAFDSTLAHYGRIMGVRNYLIIAGVPANDLEERAGYYGERVVLLAQQLGLRTCWVGIMFKRRFVRKMLASNEKLVLVVAIGYGETDGRIRKSKSPEAVSNVMANSPDWFIRGVEFALLAPTAVNQQSFRITLTDEQDADGKPLVKAVSKGGAYAKLDLGIVRLHFEIGAGLDNFAWKN